MRDEYYEEIIVRLSSRFPIKRKRLNSYLKSRKYFSEDEFYYLPRSDKIENWQFEDLVHLHVFYNKKEPYETEEDIEEGNSTFWDELELSYLMASLPREDIRSFILEVSLLSKEFDLDIIYNDKIISISDLDRELNIIADELDQKDTPAGSEVLTYLISLEYPKR